MALASARSRFSLTLLGAFAAIALLLAAVGFFGVAHTVAQRRPEIGVRMALGAKPTGILGIVLRDGMTLVPIGLVAGTAAAIGLTRFISSQLHGATTDPLTFAAVALVLSATAAVAVYLPARRASTIEPVAALRLGITKRWTRS